MRTTWCVLVLVLLVSTRAGADETKLETTRHTHHLSVGALDHRLGISIVSYARTLLGDKEHELFVGAGTIVAGTTLAGGGKYYAFHYYVDFYSVVAVHALAGMSEKIVPAPFFSMGMEYPFSSDYFFNAGVNTTVRVYIEDFKQYRKPEYVVLPHLSVTHRW